MASIRDKLVSGRPIATPPLNRKYLRAFHDYQPVQATLSGSTGGISVTVPLKEGDIVLVHLTHANGWADGTVLQTGSRGWIPTNFCQAFDHPFIRSLMHGLTQLWDYLSSEGGGKAMVDERQDYVQGLIAGVRRLLEHCDCLHRDDSRIQKNIALRRTRKALLAELSSLIQCRKQIQDTFSGTTASDVSWSTIDDYMGKAFRVACRGVRFLDLWIQSAGPQRLRIISTFDETVEDTLFSSTTASFSPTSPAHLRENINDDTTSGADDAEDAPSPERPLSLSDSHDSNSPRPQSSETDSSTNNVLPPFRTQDSIVRLSARSHAEYRRSSPLLGLQPGHADGLGIHLVESNDADLASERLSAAHDHLLGHIGAFLGLHLQSRTSLDLASATQKSLEACTGLIAIVNEIWSNDPEGSPELFRAMQQMQGNLESLADAATKLCKASDPLEDPALLKPKQGKRLVAAATACVRSAGDCTSKARYLLDQNDDFNIDMEKVYQYRLTINVLPEDKTESNRTSSGGTDQEEEAFAAREQAASQDSDVDTAGPRPTRQLHARSATAGNNDVAHFVLASEPGQRPSSSPTPSKAPGSTSLAPESSPLGTPVSPSSFLKSPWSHSSRKESAVMSAAESASTYQSSLRNSTASGRSPTSTRATTPEHSDPALLNSFSSISSMRSSATVASEESDGEADILAKSYAHELLFTRDGQVLGGTLRALVEKLTSQHSPPDPIFVNTFYLTFRQFTSSLDLAQALIDRFQYVGESRKESMPARLRVYNFMKGWLESHWLSEYDSESLSLIRKFATESLQPLIPAPGQRLAELAEKASQQNITDTATQLVNPIGKKAMALGSQYDKENVPASIISKQQLSVLRLAVIDMSNGSIMDFDAVEIARQLTLIQSRSFCAIEAEELLSLNWTKSVETSVNVRAMARFATDLTNVVADTILSSEEVKKRALIVKQWIKIGKACLDLSNYDCVMAIVCSLTSSTLIRLKATWEQVPVKSKVQFNELKRVVDVSRNYTVLRQLLQTPKAPCLPFVGIYLTDLTFIDAGNQDTRILPNSDDTVKPVEVINFDKHMRTARIISQLQRYQVPYRLQPVVELQKWLEDQMSRVRSSDDCSMQAFWRRSLEVEPRALEQPLVEGQMGSVQTGDANGRPGTSATMGGGSSFRLGHKVSKSGLNGVFTREKRDFLSTLGFKSEGELKAKLASTV